MRAVLYEKFLQTPQLVEVADPTPEPGAVVIRVMASGICRSDWNGWQGHDSDIELPHVPGHELAGVIEAVGSGITKWTVGDRVTVPFVSGCGKCPECQSGNQQVCDSQFQPGFTHWGSFAEYVAIHYADDNLVRLPDEMNFTTAASLGCRFATSFRAVVDQGRVSADQWIAVHGCGGVGLSALMIASAFGAKVIAVDISDEKLTLAKQLGAVAGVNAHTSSNVAEEIREVSNGGAHVSIDAIGNAAVSFYSIDCLRKRGRHVQVGLMVGADSRPRIPMDKVMANELEIVGSHGMQAHRYDEMLSMISAGRLSPEKLIGAITDLKGSIAVLTSMDSFDATAITVIDNAVA